MKRKKLSASDVLSRVEASEASSPDTKDAPARSTAADEKSTSRKAPFSARRTLLEGRDDEKLDSHVDNIRNIDPSLIQISEANARLQELLTEESIADLVKSIQEHGQIEAAEVRRLPEPADGDIESPRYELISGSRRLKAVIALKKPLKAVVFEDPDWDFSSPEGALKLIARSRAENESQRPTQYEYARTLVRTMGRWPNMTQQEVAGALGLSQGSISSLLAFAKFPIEAALALGGAIRSLKPQEGARWTRESDTDTLKKLIEGVRKAHPSLQGRSLISVIDQKIREKANPGPQTSKRTPKWQPLPSGAEMRADKRKGRLHVEIKLQRDLKDPDRTLLEVSENVKKLMESEG